MKYAITGIGGHLGNAIARKLVEQGAEVTGFALRNEDCSMLDPAIRIVRGDVLDPDSLKGLFEGKPDFLIHCAGVITISRKKSDIVYKVNVEGTRNIISACKAYGVNRLVYVSSVHAIPVVKDQPIVEIDHFDPDKVEGHYARSKAMATSLVLESGLDCVVVHPSGIIGPYDYAMGFMTRVVGDYYTGKLYMSIKGGFDFVDVRDVADGIISACQKGRSGQCYILSESYHEVSEIADIARNLGGKKPCFINIPVGFVKAFIPLCNLYFKTHKEKALLTSESTSILSDRVEFSHKKAELELGYHPRGIYASLSDTIDFLKTSGLLI